MGYDLSDTFQFQYALFLYTVEEVLFILDSNLSFFRSIAVAVIKRHKQNKATQQHKNVKAQH